MELTSLTSSRKWTLDKGLGAAFTHDVKAAWTEVYGILASTMIEGARSAPAT